MSRIPAKSLAIVAAAVLATSTPLALAPAVAQQTTPAATTSGIDLNARATLTIDKRLGELGSEQPATDGFEFTIERIQMTNRLNTAAGWAEAQSIIAGETPATVEGQAESMTTGSDGKATASVPVGLYRVTEVQNGAYTVAAPFFVTVPMIEQDGTVNYNPVIAPKNQNVQPTKSANDTGVTVGEDIVYTINAPVPAGDVLRDGTRTISQFGIVDQLQQGLTYNQGQPARVTINNGALAEGDYTVSWDDGNNTLTVEFTEAGRTKLAQLRADDPNLAVAVEFNATVTQIPANGEFNNTAQVYIPNSDTLIDTTPSTPNDGSDNNVTTQYVDVAVSKTLNGNNVDGDVTGAGAVFEIYECTAQGDGYQIAEGAAPLAGTNQQGNAAAEPALTAAGGSAEAAAVANGYALQFDPEKQYCAVETQAPAGYLVNPDPTPLNPTTPGSETTRPVYTTSVNDVKDNIFGRLPSTGERGMIALLAIGLVLFAGGAAYQLRRNNA